MERRVLLREHTHQGMSDPHHHHVTATKRISKRGKAEARTPSKKESEKTREKSHVDTRIRSLAAPKLTSSRVEEARCAQNPCFDIPPTVQILRNYPRQAGEFGRPHADPNKSAPDAIRVAGHCHEP